MRVVTLVIGAIFLLSLSSIGFGNVQAPTSKATQEIDQFTHRGFAMNVSALKASADRDALLKSLRGQIDMVADAGFDGRTLAFMRTILLVIDVAAVADPNYSLSTRYAKKLPKERGTEEPGSITIVPRVSNPGAPILLHEFLHAYHDQRLSEGYDNPEILRLFVEARRSSLFPADSYMLSHVREYFAMVGSVYLHGSANRDPFTRENLKTKQPSAYNWFAKHFGNR